MIRCLAIDDEPLALQQIVAYIGKVPFLELAAQCQSALEARQFLEQDTVDAIFCDINMPDLNGMDFIKSLTVPPLVVFTTAYSEYAVEGFRVNAVDYLLKPFGLQDFQRAANRLKERLTPSPLRHQPSDISPQRRHNFPQDRIPHCQGQHQRHPLRRSHERIPESVPARRGEAHRHPTVHEEDGRTTARKFYAHTPLIYRQFEYDSGGQ